jgi:hypothetical protein
MSNTLLQNKQILILMLSESVIMFMLGIAFVLSLVLVVKWDFKQHTAAQYNAERYAWLVTTIIVFATFMKFILLPYFIFSIDYLSGVVPGAMCSAGVISFNDYGMPLLYIKLLSLFLLSFWLALNYEDLQEGDYPWFKAKLWTFIAIYFLLCVEIWYQYRFFEAIDIHKVINCCSTLYGLFEGMNPLPFGLDITKLLSLYFLLYALILSSYKAQNNIILTIALILFAEISYYAIIYFFGPYIYKQPNHNCPFCMLGREYYYMGYIIWGVLGGGLFSGFSAVLIEFLLKKPKPKLKKIMAILLSIFLLICVSYVALYYIDNGVFLQKDQVDEMQGMIM